jgi:hypothetical protein
MPTMHERGSIAEAEAILVRDLSAATSAIMHSKYAAEMLQDRNGSYSQPIQQAWDILHLELKKVQAALGKLS